MSASSEPLRHDDRESGIVRLGRGLQWRDAATSVAVHAVGQYQGRPHAVVSLVDETDREQPPRTVRLAVNDTAVVGNRRFVLVGTGQGERRPHVCFRLEPIDEGDTTS